MSSKSFTLALAITAIAAMPAEATIFVYHSRAAFDAAAPHIAIDWGVFGPAGTIISTPDSRTVAPVTVTVSSSQGILARHDEGNDFIGDFVKGDHLLTDAGSQSDTFTVLFDSPVLGFGTQIESDALHGPWTGSVDLYNASSGLLGTVFIAGNRGTAENNSAPFYGFLENTSGISYARFWVNDALLDPPKSGSLAINTMDVLPSSVPEPASLLVLGGALLGLGRLRRRR